MQSATDAEFGLERLVARPVGRRHTTVANYQSMAAARVAVTRLHNMGLDLDILSLIGGESTCPPTDFEAGLARLGIGFSSATNYHKDVAAGQTLLIVHGTLTETGRAAALLERTAHCGLAEYED